jgi:hypothetical protein
MLSGLYTAITVYRLAAERDRERTSDKILRRVSRQRDLKPADVEQLPGLSTRYISRRLKVEKTYLTVDTIHILPRLIYDTP